MTSSEPRVSRRGTLEWPGEATYLAAQLARLDLLIRVELEASEARPGGGAGPELRGLVLTRGEVEADLGGGGRAPEPDPRLAAELARAEEAAAAAGEAAWRAGRPAAVEMLASLFGLSPFERDVLLVLLAPEVDRKYGRLYAFLQDDVTRRRPSVDLALRLLCRTFDEVLKGRTFFRAAAPLLHYQLVRLGEDGDGASPLLARSLRLDDRVADYLLHRDGADAALAGFSRRVVEPRPLGELSVGAAVRRRLERLVESWGAPAPAGEGRPPARCCWLEGPPGAGKEEAAAAVCGALGLGLLVVDAGRLAKSGKLDRALLARLTREAVLTGSAVLVAGMDVLYGDAPAVAGSLELVEEELDGAACPVFFAARARRPAAAGELRPAPCLSLPAADYALRRSVWRRELEAAGAAIEEDEIEALANQFRFTPGQIRAAVGQARHLELLDGGGGNGPSPESVRRGARWQCSTRMGELASKVSPVYTWDDIVLPADRLAQLREMCDQVRLRQRVMGDWGFEGKLPRGRGLSALFSGPSGTGKTMAAEIIAGDLGMDLFKIDLASVVSKYIGETEKNLQRVFAEAEQSNAILFFDEADALFGKRTEVKDSHDRYANIEINYLLQRVEEYDGVVILSTNLRGHLDDAFTRRLRVALEFPFPDEGSRRLIWQRVFPAAAPLDPGVDLDFMARSFKLSGGNIMNAALTAAFLAARDGHPIAIEDLILAVRREYQKMGRICTKSNFGRFFSLVSPEGQE